MEPHAVSRRTLLKGGTATIAGISALRMAGPADAFPGGHDEVIPWLDQPAPAPPDLPNLLVWEELDSWITPADDFFVVSHYPEPTLDPQAFRLAVSGLVARPESFDLAALQARPRRRVDFTLECSGNTGLPFFIGGIGNARWTATTAARSG
jgi:DMSO/TMAO reductase YedYZ molybdopterin-dependent catalytic subunit